MLQLRDAYLDAMAVALTRGPAPAYGREVQARNWKRLLVANVQGILERRGYRISAIPGSDAAAELAAPETMGGIGRLANVRRCVETVLREGIPGDFIETGVWRGGIVIYMRAVLLAHAVTDRTVWAADSFAGFPTERRLDADQGVDGSGGMGGRFVEVGLETVRQNFARYGLLDEQVQFLPGWFSETLPNAPIGDLAVLRLDGDLYESTWDALVALEPKVVHGGFVIVDDFGSFSQCRDAVNDYRYSRGIEECIEVVDRGCVFWRKGVVKGSAAPITDV